MPVDLYTMRRKADKLTFCRGVANAAHGGVCTAQYWWQVADPVWGIGQPLQDSRHPFQVICNNQVADPIHSHHLQAGICQNW